MALGEPGKVGGADILNASFVNNAIRNVTLHDQLA
jgi:hypothetical protein